VREGGNLPYQDITCILSQIINLELVEVLDVLLPKKEVRLFCIFGGNEMSDLLL
jgi:hypothetical protein